MTEQPILDLIHPTPGVTMNDAHADYVRQLAAERTETLRARASDRPAHLRFLNDLLGAGSWDKANELRTPKGVSERAADALMDDAGWILLALETGQSQNRYGGRYAKFRAAGAAGALTRKARATEKAPEAVTRNLPFLAF